MVTFNRLPLLQKLVERLGQVDGLAEVLVVDNASSDGTGDWLAARPTTGEVPLSGRTLTTNRGGAGGFHDGLAWAIDRDADLVWLMDDDGLPDVDCLDQLLERVRQPRLLGPPGGRRGRPGPPRVPHPACPAAPASCTRWTTCAAPRRGTGSTGS